MEEKRGFKNGIKTFFTSDSETLEFDVTIDIDHGGWFCLDTLKPIPYDGRAYKPTGSTCLYYAENQATDRSSTRKVLGGSKVR